MAQKDIELILLRQWASYMTIPIFIADSTEDLLFYNEPAGALLGGSFEDVGQMPLERMSTLFHPTTEDGRPLSPDELPLGIALRSHRPVHQRLKFCSLDGVWRTIEVTALPLGDHGVRSLGAVAIFWEVNPQ